jgi:glycosyltransferase involved in cell wall biosynthesis
VLCAGSPDTKEIGLEMAKKIEEAKKTSKNKIIWVSEMVPKKDLIALYSQASVFVCPSVYEPFGIINLEAMACETPVVASAVGGIPEVVVNGKTGILVPLKHKSSANAEPADSQKFAFDLAQAVNTVMASPAKNRRMAIESRKRVVEHFSWKSIASKTLDFYKEIIKKQNPKSQ